MREELVAIVPCNNLDEAERFFERLGFEREDGGPDDYRIMCDGRSGGVHLCRSAPEWLDAARNPFGLYLYRTNVDELARLFVNETIERDGPTEKPWGMYEFSLNGPDNLLVRVGWPTKSLSSIAD